MQWFKKRDLGRMFDWLVWAGLFYAACIGLRAYGVEPQVQVVLWKLGNVTVAAYVGYWIDRRAFNQRRIVFSSPPMEQVRRALIVAAAMLSVSLGL